ncbi:hypothetical protein E4U42_000393 [Claviceps africana]|uniref:rRNA methyltransferase 2, mitochondrial n=1 Tax=Claviceps africana TaxID=83212 RepID=A0A8K0JA20_9HYPO|nr:hypothetical protein E4U42_000393 [Claviceps africana]
MSSATPLIQTSRLCSRPSRPLASLSLPAELLARSSSRWTQRQTQDCYVREAKVNALRSRAAFKLLELDSKYHIFKSGQTVVDLVARERTRPHGQVIGIDLIPASPPRGVATFQGDFLSPAVQKFVKEFIARTRSNDMAGAPDETEGPALDEPSYIDKERHASEDVEGNGDVASSSVDVVLSDMSESWPRTSGYMSRTLTNPYYRLMNTSGVVFRDHIGSMDLCTAALQFASDTLKPGGHFVCKFYQGGEDKKFEDKLKRMFSKVSREKPDSSRSESREAYFVALRRKRGVLLTAE